MEDIEHPEHVEEHMHLPKPLAEHRKDMVKHAYKHYTLPEFKVWASDVCIELAQQLSRINTEKFDKSDLIKALLMVEDSCCILRMLLHKDENTIDSIATEIYCRFADMLKAHGLALDGQCSYNKPAKITVSANSLK